MRNEYDANIALQAAKHKPCRAEAIEHYRPSGEWSSMLWCAGVIAGGALVGFLAGLVSAYL